MTPPERTDEALPSFGQYAAWYDAFNHEKDYATEVAYVLNAVRTLNGPPARWLDVGCGTGHHLAYLHARGIRVEGIDRSPAMIARARAANVEIPFHVASAQEFDLEGARDVVSMLFHVINYQVDDSEVRAAIRTVAAHLAPQGLFVLDFWHTGGVVRSRPVRRIREALIDGRRLLRISVPQEDVPARRVDVRFEFRWDSPAGPLIHEELHHLRHFAPEELEAFLNEAGLSVVTCRAWMQERSLADDDWQGFVCARLETHP